MYHYAGGEHSLSHKQINLFLKLLIIGKNNVYNKRNVFSSEYIYYAAP